MHPLFYMYCTHLVFTTIDVTICMPSVSLNFRLNASRQPHQEPEDEEASQACDDHRVVPALEALEIGLVRHLSLSIESIPQF